MKKPITANSILILEVSIQKNNDVTLELFSMCLNKHPIPFSSVQILRSNSSNIFFAISNKKKSSEKIQEKFTFKLLRGISDRDNIYESNHLSNCGRFLSYSVCVYEELYIQLVT